MTLVLLFALTANALTLLAESYSGCRFLPATARTDRDCGPLPPKSGRVSTSAVRTHPYPVRPLRVHCPATPLSIVALCLSRFIDGFVALPRLKRRKGGKREGLSLPLPSSSFSPFLLSSGFKFEIRR